MRRLREWNKKTKRHQQHRRHTRIEKKTKKTTHNDFRVFSWSKIEVKHIRERAHVYERRKVNNQCLFILLFYPKQLQFRFGFYGFFSLLNRSSVSLSFLLLPLVRISFSVIVMWCAAKSVELLPLRPLALAGWLAGCFWKAIQTHIHCICVLIHTTQENVIEREPNWEKAGSSSSSNKPKNTATVPVVCTVPYCVCAVSLLLRSCLSQSVSLAIVRLYRPQHFEIWSVAHCLWNRMVHTSRAHPVQIVQKKHTHQSDSKPFEHWVWIELLRYILFSIRSVLI